MTRILIVDDKEMMRDSVGATLSRRGHQVVAASSGRAAIDKLAARRVDAVVTDLQMPGMDGLELLEEIRRLDEDLPVVVMTAFGSIETAVHAMKQGAWDYVTKPFSGDELAVTVERAIEHRALRRENQVLKAQVRRGGEPEAETRAMVGSGSRMGALRDQLERIADSHGTVLVTGESGSGKEVAARWIHEHSPRRDGPFLAINCAALSTSLLESELFGHEKGAFTGADKLRKGRFELADGGTLLLDEISEIAPAIQAKLLRVLQEQAFERVGSSRSMKVDVRVIATSNRSLPAEVRRGSFREDLYYRLNVLPVEMPPLRERTEDLPELVDHFLGLVAAREGRPAPRVDPLALELLARYAWPGNVRELQNVCERAAVLTRGEAVPASLIAPWLGARPLSGSAVPGSPVEIEAGDRVAETPLRHGAPGSFVEAKPDAEAAGVATADGAAGASIPTIVCDGEQVTLDEIEREVIVQTLLSNGGHRVRSAKALGIGVRTLGLKLKKWKEQSLVPGSL